MGHRRAGGEGQGKENGEGTGHREEPCSRGGAPPVRVGAHAQASHGASTVAAGTVAPPSNAAPPKETPCE